MEEISIILDRIFIKENGELDELNIPNVIETQNGLFEEISDLNGIAIPCYYYDYLLEGSQQSNILLSLIQQNINNMRFNEHCYLKNIVNSLPEKLETISDYLYLANISIAVQETLYFKLKQIKREEYSWLNENILEECKLRLNNIIDNDNKNSQIKIEETIISGSNDIEHKAIDDFLLRHFDSNIRFRFTARVDLITENTVWELKCTSKISMDHLLQLTIYAWLWRTCYENDNKKFCIFNIRTKEFLSLNCSLEDLNTIILLLLKGKFNKQEKKSDEVFIKDCKNYLFKN